MSYKNFIINYREEAGGRIPVVTGNLSFSDILGILRVRFLVNRSSYMVPPGLYALGNPSPASNVFVSANYKYSFDELRNAIKGLDAWILVIDTKGINVWCAAGKGTFGTAELANRIKNTSLEKTVNHRKVIVPQLGAPGVSAHEVKKLSGFSVIYGPVRAGDTQAFINAGLKAEPAMRLVNFGLADRIKLVPVEFVGGMKYLLIASSLVILLSGIQGRSFSSTTALDKSVLPLVNIWLAYIAGTVFGPLFLPVLPGRAFAFKGFCAGVIFFVISLVLGFMPRESVPVIAWLLFMSSLSSFILMNFTGASTYTSLSGVKKEMKVAVPLQAASAAASLILFFLKAVL